jgi:hypothetical protein
MTVTPARSAATQAGLFCAPEQGKIIPNNLNKLSGQYIGMSVDYLPTTTEPEPENKR